MLSDEQYENLFLSLLDRHDGLSLLDKRNKVVGLMMSARLNDARKLLLEVIATDGNSSSQYSFMLLGILDSLLSESGSLELAFKQWEKGRKAMYRDAAGGVELWVLWRLHARVLTLPKLEAQANTNLNKFAKIKGGGWPGVLSKVALGLSTRSDVEPLMAEQPFLRRKQEILLNVALEAAANAPSISELYSKISHDRIPGYTLPEFHYVHLLSTSFQNLLPKVSTTRQGKETLAGSKNTLE